MKLCLILHSQELPPTASSVKAVKRLSALLPEYASCPPSCWMLRPIPATARARERHSGRACHQVLASKTSSQYETVHQPRISAVFMYIRGRPRWGSPVLRKYSSTRVFSSAWKFVLRAYLTV